MEPFEKVLKLNKVAEKIEGSEENQRLKFFEHATTLSAYFDLKQKTLDAVRARKISKEEAGKRILGFLDLHEEHYREIERRTGLDLTYFLLTTPEMVPTLSFSAKTKDAGFKIERRIGIADPKKQAEFTLRVENMSERASNIVKEIRRHMNKSGEFVGLPYKYEGRFGPSKLKDKKFVQLLRRLLSEEKKKNKD